MNFIDKVVGFFSPGVLVQRIKARALSAMLDQSLRGRKYDAAGNGRKTKNWQTWTSSANVEATSASNRLVNRSRDLTQNNPYAHRALKIIPSNVIRTGILPAIKVNGKRAQEKLRKFWTTWSESIDCDFDERKTFAAIQRLAFRSMLESGESFTRKVYDKDKGLQLQVLESDHLDRSKHFGVPNTKGNTVRYGIEFKPNGKRAGYWLFEHHPGELNLNFKVNSVFVPADQVIHLYMEDRPGQLLGVPHGSSAMLRVKDLDDYEETELTRQKVAACFSVFITSMDHGAPIKDDDGVSLEQVEPGIIERLKPGEQVQFAAPPGTDGYNEHTKRVLQGISAGYDMPYESMSGDLSNVNFSSGRMGKMDFQNLVEEWQELLMIPLFCKTVFKWFLEFAKISGAVTADAVVECTWTAPAREFIDPLKEVKALVEKVRANFISWQEAVRSLGYEPEEILSQLQADAERFSALGLMPTSDPRFDPNRNSKEPAA